MNPLARFINQVPAHSVRTVARLTAHALDGLDLYRWLLPDDGERAVVLPRYHRMLIEHAIEVGTVEAVPGLSAIAVWLPGPPADIPDYQRRLRAECGAATPRFQALDEAMGNTHPAEPEHEYLALLTVSPERRGEGLATALLLHRHTELDRLNMPAYTVAPNEPSRRLLHRHGYIDIAAPIRLPYDGSPLFPMFRMPYPRPTAHHRAARHRGGTARMPVPIPLGGGRISR